MKISTVTLILTLIIIAMAGTALAQGLIGPSGSDYTVRFTVSTDADEVCLFRVDPLADPIIKSDAVPVACTTAVVGDDVTINELVVAFTPPLEMDTPVALTANRRVMVEGEERLLESALSNWASLASFLAAPVLVL